MRVKPYDGRPGAFGRLDGLVSMWPALANRRGEPQRAALVIGGIAGIVIGIVMPLMPAITAIVLLYFIAAGPSSAAT